MGEPVSTVAVGATLLVASTLLEIGCENGVKKGAALVGQRLSLGKLDANHDISRAARMAQLNASIYLTQTARDIAWKEALSKDPALKYAGRGPARTVTSKFEKSLKSLRKLATKVKTAKLSDIHVAIPNGGYVAVERAVADLLLAEKHVDANSSQMQLAQAALEEATFHGGWSYPPSSLKNSFSDDEIGFRSAFNASLSALLKHKDWEEFYKIWCVLRAEATNDTLLTVLQNLEASGAFSSSERQAAATSLSTENRIQSTLEHQLNELTNSVGTLGRGVEDIQATLKRIESKLDLETNSVNQPIVAPAKNDYRRLVGVHKVEYIERAISQLQQASFQFDEFHHLLVSDPNQLVKAVAAYYCSSWQEFAQYGSPRHAKTALDVILLAASEEELRPGTIFKDTSNVPIMKVLGPGRFQMGAANSDIDAYDNEKPQRTVKIDHSYAISIAPITFHQYDHFCLETGNHLPDDQGWGRDNRPAIHVSWNQAVEYVNWLSNITGQTYRLLSEAEWEFAARAGTTHRYLQADTRPGEIGNCDEDIGMTTTVTTYPPNDWGLYDMLGNVWEWVSDSWYPNYAGAPSNGSARISTETKLKCLRGGSWDCVSRHMRVTDRCRQGSENQINNVGFRVARFV